MTFNVEREIRQAQFRLDVAAERDFENARRRILWEHDDPEKKRWKPVFLTTEAAEEIVRERRVQEAMRGLKRSADPIKDAFSAVGRAAKRFNEMWMLALTGGIVNLIGTPEDQIVFEDARERWERENG